jgi:hypothetical protein
MYSPPDSSSPGARPAVLSCASGPKAGFVSRGLGMGPASVGVDKGAVPLDDKSGKGKR